MVKVTAPSVPRFVAIPGLEESIEKPNNVLLLTVHAIGDVVLLPEESSVEFSSFVALFLFESVTVKTVPPPLTSDVAVQLEKPCSKLIIGVAPSRNTAEPVVTIIVSFSASFPVAVVRASKVISVALSLIW